MPLEAGVVLVRGGSSGAALEQTAPEAQEAGLATQELTGPAEG